MRAIRSGAVQTVAGVSRITERGAVLNDGRAIEADVILLATGYRPALDYLDFPFETDKDGWFVRDTRDNPDSTEAFGYPGLYLVGRFYRGLGPLYNIRHEAQTAVRQIGERLRRLESVATPER